MHVNNTTARAFAIELEHGFKKGITITGGLQYGNQNHDVDIERDLSDFDSDARQTLKGVVWRDAVVVSTTYIAPRILIGYRKKLNEKWALAVKAGVEMKMFYNGVQRGDQPTYITYFPDGDTLNGRMAGFISKNILLGKAPNSTMRFPAKTHTFEFYIGTEYSFKKGFIKNFSVGIEANRCWRWNQDGDGIYIYSMKSWQEFQQEKASYDKYLNRNVSIGLRLAVGLWK